MKKIALSLALVVSCYVGAHALNTVTNTKWHILVDSQTVNATATVSSDALYVGDYESFSYVVVVHSGSAPEVDVTYQIINSNASNYTLVETTESLSGIQPVWVQPATDGTMAPTVSASTADAFAPAATKYIRVSVVGTASNGADTVVSVYLCGYASR